MIDNEGFRANVGIIICNSGGQIFWARRYNQHSWQFPQGGIDQGETAEQAMYRELYEEVGLKKEHVKILAVSRNWLRYKLPKRLVRQGNDPVCIGQKQKWFLLTMTCEEKAVDLTASGHPEFDDWRWVSYWYPIRNVVAFKRDVYRRILKEFSNLAMNAYRNSSGASKKNRKRHRQKLRSNVST
ncbi:MAG: RNA pyrophosphohydrolase [Pseudomonadota bacterium]